jgi:acyl-ACP thioesterase
MKKFIQDYTIGSYHTNQYAKASVTSLFNMMLEAAWKHAQVMDWGYDNLKLNNMFWVLSRVYFEFERYPDWQEEITLNTWSAGTDGMYAYREFIIERAQKEVLLKASSAWLILDVETKRIVRLREFMDTFPRLNESQPCRNPKRIKPPKASEGLSYRPVLFSDLDVNKHFNSVKYLERILDCLGIDFLNQYELASLEINYLKEGMAGDQLGVDTQKLDDLHYKSTIFRESDGLPLCCMDTHWRARKA